MDLTSLGHRKDNLGIVCMEELTIVSRQEAGIASIDNFEEIKAALQQELSIYKTIVYTPDTIKTAKRDKAALNKLKKVIEDRRKEIKRVIMEPYSIVEAQAKELVALIEEPLSLINVFITQEEELEKAAKRTEIESYYRKVSASLGDFSEALWNSPSFYEKNELTDGADPRR